MKDVFYIMVLAMFGFWIVRAVVMSQEMYECAKWENEQIEYGQGGWRNWQVEQCSEYGATLIK